MGALEREAETQAEKSACYLVWNPHSPVPEPAAIFLGGKENKGHIPK
jgi:hypothetical protein